MTATKIPAADRLFIAHCATGTFFCDKTVEVDRDFKALAHVFNTSLKLEWDATRVDQEMRELIMQRAEQHIEKKHEERRERNEIARSHLQWRIGMADRFIAEQTDDEVIAKAHKERKRLQNEIDALPAA